MISKHDHLLTNEPVTRVSLGTPGLFIYHTCIDVSTQDSYSMIQNLIINYMKYDNSPYYYLSLGHISNSCDGTIKTARNTGS